MGRRVKTPSLATLGHTSQRWDELTKRTMREQPAKEEKSAEGGAGRKGDKQATEAEGLITGTTKRALGVFWNQCWNSGGSLSTWVMGAWVRRTWRSTYTQLVREFYSKEENRNGS